jgi:signal transduction histidine kinase
VHLVDVIEITALLAALLNLALTMVVLGRNFGSRLRRVYALWGISVTLWTFGMFRLSQANITRDQAFRWANVMELGMIFMPVAMFHLSSIILGWNLRRWLATLYGLHVAFAVTLAAGWFVRDMRLDPQIGYWPIAGWAFHWFAFTYLGVTLALAMMLYRGQKAAAPTHRLRLRALFVAVIVMFLFGLNDFLPVLWVDNYPFTPIKVWPLGSLAALFYVVIIAYSVFQHRLLDIKMTLSRSAAQFVRLAFMFLIGFILLLVLERFAPEKFNPFSFAAFSGALLASALGASILFPHFFGKVPDRLERRILGDRFEYTERAHSVIATIRSFPEPKFALQELNDLLAITMGIRSYQIVLLDEATRGFALYHSHPPRAERALPDWQVESPAFRFFQETRARYLSCSPVYETDTESLLLRQARQQVKEFEPEFCFPFYSGNDVVGFMLLGAKASAEIFTPNDLWLLSELSSSLGLLLNQLRLRDQLQTVHEQDLLGRMSRGLAHDLNNLLTPVQTLLQLMRESALNQSSIDELLPVCLHNLETVRAYVDEALFFSHSSKLQGRPGLLDEAIRDSISLVEPAATIKGVQIHFDAFTETIVEMDNVLIKRLLSNLLSNAIDASQTGSRVDIQLTPLPKTEVKRDWHRLKIIDYGVGISAENLRRVCTPYFTTKNTGDGKRGFGLGLAIARKIVHLHGGTLSITSKEKKGTTVQVDLPSKLSPVPGRTSAGVNSRGEPLAV